MQTTETYCENCTVDHDPQAGAPKEIADIHRDVLEVAGLSEGLQQLTERTRDVLRDLQRAGSLRMDDDSDVAPVTWEALRDLEAARRSLADAASVLTRAAHAISYMDRRR